MNLKRSRILACAMLLAAPACGSHASNLPPAMGGTPATTQSTATLSIVVATASNGAISSSTSSRSANSSLRRPLYVSPSSAQLSVSVNGGSATTYGLTPQTPGCSVISGNLTCAFSIAAAPGPDTFALSLLDASGTVLSRNVVSATLTAGQSTPVNVTLAGVPASVIAIPGKNSAIEGTASPAYHFPGLNPQPIELEALDADGNVIIGPGAPTINAPTVSMGSPYATVTSANSTDPNAYIVRPVGAGAGGQTISVTASAQGVALNDGTTSAPVSSATSFLFTPAIAVGSGISVTIYSVETGKVVAQFGACAGGCPATIVNGTATNANGDIFVSYKTFLGLSPGYTVERFAAGATTPTQVLGASNGVTGAGAITVDANGMLYVANAASGFGLARKQASITEYLPGTTTPKYTISGALTGISGPQGIAVDSSGLVYLTNSNGTITIYGTGNRTAPSQTLTDPSLANPSSIVIDASKNIYVVDSANLDIAYFAAGSPTVTNTLRDGSFSNSIASLMLDPGGNIWASITNLHELERLDAGALPTAVSAKYSIPNASGYMSWIP